MGLEMAQAYGFRICLDAEFARQLWIADTRVG